MPWASHWGQLLGSGPKLEEGGGHPVSGQLGSGVGAAVVGGWVEGAAAGALFWGASGLEIEFDSCGWFIFGCIDRDWAEDPWGSGKEGFLIVFNLIKKILILSNQ